MSSQQAENKKLPEIDPEQAAEMLKQENTVLIDIRGADEFARAHIPGARLVPLATLSERTAAGQEDHTAIFICATGMRTRIAASDLANAGFRNAFAVRRGLSGWIRAGLPVEGSDAGKVCTASAGLAFLILAVFAGLAILMVVRSGAPWWQGVLVVLVVLLVSLMSPCVGGRILPVLRNLFSSRKASTPDHHQD